MKKIMLFLMSNVALASHTSSIEPLLGDDNTAPLEDTGSRPVPGDRVVPPLDGSGIDEAVANARRAYLDAQRQALEEAQKNVKLQPPPKPTRPAPKIARVLPKKTKAQARVQRANQRKPRPIVLRRPAGPTITIFRQNLRASEEMITLPSGAHAFARVKFGEEVAAGGEQEVLAELDYAFLGPNKSVVEMNGCVIWLKVTSNFNTQRVRGSLQDLTCTMDSGRVFTVPMGGTIVDVASGYAGVDSEMIMRGPAKAAALTFLSEITSAYGAATSAVETTTRMMASGDDRTDTSKNVTGDRRKYIGGKVIQANGKFLEYVAGFFASMQPTLALRPGAKVHIVNRFNIKIPKAFFKSVGGKK